MIVCVCLSPAIDVTYHVARLTTGGTTRVRSVARRPGGKGVNVARILTALGVDACVVAPVGGPSGAEFAALLTASGTAGELVPDAAATRSTVTVVDDAGEASVLVEPAELSSWPTLRASAARAIATADIVVASGSVPHGAPVDAVGELVRLARGAGRPVLVDTSGPALVAALRAGPTVAKPNADELAGLGAAGAEPSAVARALAREYRCTVVASLGADGVVAATSDMAWRARPGDRLRGNPTGAGDALVAGLARGIAAGQRMPQVLFDAVALSAAAVLHPYAGQIDVAEHEALRDGVVLEPLGGAQ